MAILASGVPQREARDLMDAGFQEKGTDLQEFVHWHPAGSDCHDQAAICLPRSIALRMAGRRATVNLESCRGNELGLV